MFLPTYLYGTTSRIPFITLAIELTQFQRLSRAFHAFDQFHVEKFPAPMINLLWLFAVSCASYLLFVPGTTRNFPPGEAGGENVFSFVPI